MLVNSHFVIAIHILALLAYEQGQGRKVISSDYIAGSVNSNPVIIRRVLGALSKAGLVNNHSGKGGGSTLLKLPKKISLLEVYRAVIPNSDKVFALHPNTPNPRCPVGSKIQQALTGNLHEVQTALEAPLAKSTLAQVLKSLAQASPRK